MSSADATTSSQDDPLFLSAYRAARDRFLSSARQAGLEVWSQAHPEVGLHGEALFMDFAWWGSRQARRVLVTLSGTHGVEGIYGSACQSGWLEKHRPAVLADDVAVFLVHAVNPYGFSWLRRVDHEHIDVNRNAINWAAPAPVNPDYDQVHAMLLPEKWDAAHAAALFGALKQWMADKGPRAATRAITGGQYTHPDGMFFGGLGPSWSARVLEREVQARLSHARVVTVLDHHTGLGPNGHTEIICRHPADSSSLALARQWWGADVTAPALGESDSQVIDGNVRMAFERWCPSARVVAAALEVGTLAGEQVLAALVADHWLHQRGQPRSAQGEAIRAQIQGAFYVDTPQWRRACFERAMCLYAASLHGLEALNMRSLAEGNA
jgi:Protein of unknown function (DUF2817)